MTSLYPVALKKFLDSFFSDVEISDFSCHTESKEYSACRFKLNDEIIEFRSSKITLKKTGAFVTIWKRTNEGITEPFDNSDDFDMIIVACEHETKFGAFIFPKSVLLAHKIISINGVGGKRGVRVYPSWDVALNPQAKKTQIWQQQYFSKSDSKTLLDYSLLKKSLS